MRLLLIEDDPVIARELALRWRGRGWHVGHASRLSEADALVAAAAFDLVVLDLGLPDGDGLEWLQRRRQRDRATPMLVLTARDRVDDRVRGLKAGADDYLVKPFAPEELDARLEVLARRLALADGGRIAHGPLAWHADEGRIYAAGRPLDLLPREVEVLGLLIRRAPRLVPKRALIDALSERNIEVGDSAAEVYVSRLRRKLQGSGAAIRTLRGFGYVLDVEGMAGTAGAEGDGAGSA